MRELSSKRTHPLRIQVYQQIITAQLILAITEVGKPRIIDTIAGLPSYGVFTDDSALRFWDPRGSEYQIFYGYDLFPFLQQHNPGSMFINPKGEIRGELYKNELHTLYNASLKIK